ncbi:hypothetical protein Tco_1209508 [Tanacetum coccineum]
MTILKFADTHNIVAFLSQPKAKTINGEVQLLALVDGKKIIVTEASVRRDLQLADEEDEAVYKELDAKVESSGDEESLGEDVSKQGRINAIDADEDITLVSVQDDANKEMFDVNVLDGKEMLVEEQEVVVKEVNDEVNVIEEVVEVINTAKLIFDAAYVSTASAATTVSAATTTTADDFTLAQALQELKIVLKLQAEIDEEERITIAEEEKIDEANIAWDDIQAKVDAGYQLAERLQAEE